MTPESRVVLSRRATRPAVTCRTASLRDYDQVRALAERFGMAEWSRAEWSHLWVNNPVVRRTPDLPIGWALEDAQSQVVGFMGSIPFGFEFEGRSLVASTGHSWVVDERYRAYAPILLERLASQPGIDLHIVLGPNGHAQPLVEQQFARMPAAGWDRVGYWVTDTRAFAMHALAAHGAPNGRLRRYRAWAAHAFRQARLRDRVGEVLRPGRRYRVQTLTRFDDRFDDLWASLRARHPRQLLLTRSREVLEWRFGNPLAKATAWIATVTDGGHLLAYAVFGRHDARRSTLRRVQLIDYQSLDDDIAILASILADALERCRRDGVAVLQNVGWSQGAGSVMDRLAPTTRPLTEWQYFYRTGSPALHRRLHDPAVWRPSNFDRDVCI